MKNIYDIFGELDINYKLYEHPAFYTCDESEKWYKENIDEPFGESKNLFLRNKKGNKHFLVVIESKKQLDLKALASQLDDRNLSFASPNRLKKYLNLEPGSVSILALLYENAKDVTVIFDEDLLRHENLHYHPPTRNDQTLMISTNDLKNFMAWLKNPIKFAKL